MKNKRSSLRIVYLILVSIILGGQLLSQEVVLERALPPGWVFKSFYYKPHDENARSALKALFLIQDLPVEIRASGRVARRLQVFDSAGNPVADLILPEWHWFEGFIGNDRLLVSLGDEGGAGQVKVLDLNGHEIYSLEAGGRWVQQAVLGSDFALVPRLGEETGPVSIIDGEKGREKLKIGPYPEGPQGLPLPSCFLLIGDGYFLTGLGATLFLENYNQPGQKLWMIKDIGGNIQEARILRKDLIAVSYDIKTDFKRDEFIAGLAVIEWKTGRVLFRKSARQEEGRDRFWYQLIRSLNIGTEEDGSLLFYLDDEAIKLPKEKASGQEWDEAKVVRLRINPSQKSQPAPCKENFRIKVHGNYVVKDYGNFVRVEKRTWISD
jgi:hypothetical protein